MTIEEYEQLSEIEGYSQILNDLLTNGKCTVRLHIGSDYHEYRITDSDPDLFDCAVNFIYSMREVAEERLEKL